MIFSFISRRRYVLLPHAAERNGRRSRVSYIVEKQRNMPAYWPYVYTTIGHATCNPTFWHHPVQKKSELQTPNPVIPGDRCADAIHRRRLCTQLYRYMHGYHGKHCWHLSTFPNRPVSTNPKIHRLVIQKRGTNHHSPSV